MWTKFKTPQTAARKPTRKRSTPLTVKEEVNGSQSVKQIKKRSRQGRRAWKQYGRFPSRKDFENCKQIRNKVVSMIRADEEEYNYNSRILLGFKGKPRRFYGHMRRLQTVKDGVSALKRPSGGLTTTDQRVADVLRNFFQSVFTKAERLERFQD